MSFEDALIALADPARRAVLEQVCKRPCAIADIAHALKPMSQPAVAQHLKALEEAKLVKSTRDGFRVFYSAETQLLVGLRDFFIGIVGDIIADRRSAAETRRPQPAWRAHR